MASLDIRVLAEAFPPTTTVYNADNNPAKSAKSVLLPASVLSDLHDTEYIRKLRESSPVRVDPTPTVRLPESGPSSFADALRTDANMGVLSTGTDNHTWTTNRAGAYASTEDAVLDAFFGLGQWSDGTEVQGRLEVAWAQDPEMTLRLIFNLRSIHEGKNARNLFFHAFGWLYREHPVTAIGNLDQIVAQVCEDARNVPARKKWEQAQHEKKGEMEEDVEEEFIERPARSHGCWKDLLSIVSLAYHNQLGNPKMDPESLKKVFGPAPYFKANHEACEHPVVKEADAMSEVETPKGVPRRFSEAKYAELLEQMTHMHLEEWKDKAKKRRHDNHEAMTTALAKKLTTDLKFRSLYVAVARLFGDALVHDTNALVGITNLRKTKGDKRATTNEVRKLGNSISLAAKWAPSAGRSFDRQFLMTSAIAEVVFPFNGSADSPEREEHGQKARNMLRRYVLTPLRDFIAVPESNMHPDKWGKIQYSRVPAVAFTSNKSLFWHHDEKRFVAHLEAIGKGKRTISGASLLPHDIMIRAIDAAGNLDLGDDRHPQGNGRRGGASKKMVKAHHERKMKNALGKLYSGIYDAQWRSMVEHIAALGALDNCIAICDVSGSMGSIHQAKDFAKGAEFDNSGSTLPPIFPAVALSIIVAQIAAAPWKNMFITFASRPELVQLLEKSPDGSSAGLAEIANTMSIAHWGSSTNFKSVFLDLLLPTAKRHNLTKDQMVKRVFVFSDMQFDSASRGIEWKTVHQVVKAAFEKEGYDMPEVVYWNLAGGRYQAGHGLAAPVDKEEEGVSLLSGFSGSMLKAFVGEEVEEEMWAEEAKEEKEWDDADVELEAETSKEKVQKEKPKPADKMKKILSGKSYAGLKVYD